MLGFVRWRLVPLPASAVEVEMQEEPSEAASSTGKQ